MLTRIKEIVEKYGLNVQDIDYVEGLVKALYVDTEIELRNKLTECITGNNFDAVREITGVLEELVKLNNVENRVMTTEEVTKLEINHTRNNISIKAYADYFENKVTVIKKGSQIHKVETNSIPQCAKKARQELIKDSKVMDKGNYYEVLEDIICKTPSEASCIVVAGSSSGPEEFKLEGTNKKLGEYMKERGVRNH